jgi:hypothetical protein
MKSVSVPKMPSVAIPAYANGGLVNTQETFNLNISVGSATMPLKVVGRSSDIRSQIKRIEKELSKMRLSHA